MNKGERIAIQYFLLVLIVSGPAHFLLYNVAGEDDVKLTDVLWTVLEIVAIVFVFLYQRKRVTNAPIARSFLIMTCGVLGLTLIATLAMVGHTTITIVQVGSPIDQLFLLIPLLFVVATTRILIGVLKHRQSVV